MFSTVWPDQTYELFCIPVLRDYEIPKYLISNLKNVSLAPSSQYD